MKHLINHYAYEDGHLVSFEFYEIDSTVELRVLCPISVYHPEFRKMKNRLVRLLSGAIYSKTDGREVCLQFANCSNVSIEITEAPNYKDEPDRIRSWNYNENADGGILNIETDGGHYSVQIGSLDMVISEEKPALA